MSQKQYMTRSRGLVWFLLCVLGFVIFGMYGHAIRAGIRTAIGYQQT
jgi:hypothetical protein